MAITLRYTTTDTTGKTSELSYQEMNNNLKSYFYSSSLNGEVLNLFYLTGSQSQSIDLSTFVTQLESGSLLRASQTGSFYYSSSVRLNTITFYQGDGTTDTVTVDTGSGGVAATVDTGSFYYSSSVNLNTITFYQGDGTTESVTVDTGSGGSGTPGGSDTQVQFNDGGSTFGGDSGLTYNKTANRLTITAPSSPTRTAPNLLLNSELSDVTAGEVLGVIAANNATDQYNPANYPASIQFVADTNFFGGIYDTSIRLFTNDGATEKEALRLINTGQAKLPQYGAGSFTGTNAYYLAVSASGEVIETAPPGGFTRPGSDTSVTYDTYLQTVNTYSVNAVGTNPAAPSSNGDVSIRYAVSNIGSNVDRIDVYDSDGTDRSATLLNLATSGSITLLQVGAGGHTEVYRIISVTDNGSYVSYAVSWVSGDDAAISTITTDTFTFNADYEYELSAGYNRLLVTNNSNSSANQLRFAPPAGASAGDEVIVELKVNTGSVNVRPTYLVRNGTPTFQVARRVSELNGSTVTAMELDTNDVAIMKFQVNDIGSVEGLMLLGAAQMVYA